jgi:glycosyltransferase involved in cell wall biosynthesis
MRIVLATSDLAIGGAERNVVSYACRLRRRGHDVTVVAGDGVLAAELEGCGVPRVSARPHLLRPLSIARTARALRTLHQERHIDVVHAFMASASVAAALGRLRLGRPYALAAAPPGLAQGRREGLWLSRIRLRLLVEGADVILWPSADLRGHLLQAGAPESRLRELAFNAVDVERFDVPPVARESIGLRPSDRVACSVARLHPIKGQDLLIRAAPLLREQVPEAKLLLVGDGPARATLEQLARDLGVTDMVRFAGARTDVPAILQSVDVVVQTTFGTGGPGLAVLEAFAASRPIVGFAFSDLRDTLAQSDAGILVERGDVAGLAGAISSVLGDPARARAMGRSGRRLVASQFDIERVLDHLEGIYRELAT